MEADRKQQLFATKLLALVRASQGIDTSEVVPDPNFNRGAACVINGSAWVYVASDCERALGAALAWVETKCSDARQLHLVVEEFAGIVARRAKNFTRRINVWRIKDSSLEPALPSDFAVPVEAKGSHLELRSLIEAGGAQMVIEHGVVAGEVLGLEVCRVLDDENGEPKLEVGVGAHDREAFGLLHGHLPTVEAVVQHASAVRPHREAAIGTHPLNRLAASRLLRARVVDKPEIIGCSSLTVAEPPVPRAGLKEELPCVAKGLQDDGKSVVVVFAFGIDLETIPFAADSRAWINPNAELLVVVPERDVHRISLALASRVAGGCRVVGVAV